jgi:hypothetical protein
MITRALDAGVPVQWVAADEVYGGDPGLRADLEARQIGYVLAIGCDRRVPTAAGPMRADTLAANLPKGAWQRLSAGPGAKGQRYYDWAWVTLTAQARHHWLLVRRHPRHGELAFYRCYCPTLVALANWSESPDADGPSRRTFRPPKAWPGSTNTKSTAGCHGDAGPCSPCSRTPYSSSSPPPNAPNTRPSQG